MCRGFFEESFENTKFVIFVEALQQQAPLAVDLRFISFFEKWGQHRQKGLNLETVVVSHVPFASHEEVKAEFLSLKSLFRVQMIALGRRIGIAQVVCAFQQSPSQVHVVQASEKIHEVYKAFGLVLDAAHSDLADRCGLLPMKKKSTKNYSKPRSQFVRIS